MTNGSSHRQARLSEALRANLRRRKSQARARPVESIQGEIEGDAQRPDDPTTKEG